MSDPFDTRKDRAAHWFRSLRDDITAAFEEVVSADKTWREYPGFFHEIYFELERARPLADLSAWLDAHTKAAG